MTVTLGADTDAFELAAAGDHAVAPRDRRGLRRHDRERHGEAAAAGRRAPRQGRARVSLASTALVGLGESARYLDEYPYDCAEQKASRALALLLSADLGGAFPMSGLKPDDLRTAGLAALRDLTTYQCPDGGFGLFPGSCYGPSSVYLTAYILDVMERASALKWAVARRRPIGSRSIARCRISRASCVSRRPRRSGGRRGPPRRRIPCGCSRSSGAIRGGHRRLLLAADRMPVFALSYRGRRPRGDRATAARAIRTSAATHDEQAREWMPIARTWRRWTTRRCSGCGTRNVRATAVVLDGWSRRNDDATFVAPLVRWLLAARENGRWGTTHENATALGALVNYYKTFETDVPNMTATVTLGGRAMGQATFAGRTTTAQQLRLEMPDLVKQVPARRRAIWSSRAPAPAACSTPRGCSTHRSHLSRRSRHPDRAPVPARTRGRLGPADTTTFEAGDLVRVTLTRVAAARGTVPGVHRSRCRRLRAVDGSLKTTATDLAGVSTTQSSGARLGRLVAPRRLRFRREARRPSDRLRHATGRRPSRVHVSGARDDGRNVRAAGTFGEAMYAPDCEACGCSNTADRSAGRRRRTGWPAARPVSATGPRVPTFDHRT